MACLAVLLLIWAGPGNARAEEAAHTPDPSPPASAPAEPAFKPAKGPVPAGLAGRWLVVATVEGNTGVKTPLALGLNFESTEAGLVLAQLLDPLPGTLGSAAQREGKPWVPTDRELADLRAAWPAATPGTGDAESSVFGRGKLPADVSTGPKGKRRLAFFTFTRSFPGDQVSRRSLGFTVDSMTPNEFKGTLQSVTTILIPTVGVAPLGLSGPYRARRVSGPPIAAKAPAR